MKCRAKHCGNTATEKIRGVDLCRKHFHFDLGVLKTIKKPSQKEVAEARQVIKNTLQRLDECWEHHLDGSDLRMTESELFTVVFNEILSHSMQPNPKKPTGLIRAFMLLGGDFEEIRYIH